MELIIYMMFYVGVGGFIPVGSWARTLLGGVGSVIFLPYALNRFPTATLLLLISPWNSGF